MSEPTAKRIVAIYFYTDEQGATLYEVVRHEPKEFRQRVPDTNAKGGYRWKLDGVRRVPYRLPELRRAIEKEATLYVVEGEKDCATLVGFGLSATTSAQGSGWKWPPEFVESFRGAKRVIVIADCDESGRKAARERAALLRTVVDDVRHHDLDPDRNDGYDVSDWLADGHTREELEALAEAAPRVVAPAVDEIIAQLLAARPLERDSARKSAAEMLGTTLGALDEEVRRRKREEREAARAANGGEAKESRGPSIATKLVGLVLGTAELLHDGDETGASVTVNGHRETHRVLSTSFRRYAVQGYYEKYGTAPNGAAVREALDTIDARARFEGVECALAMRCAKHDDTLFLDLVNADWSAVAIRADGWSIVPAVNLPVRFVRTRNALPLPIPDPAGKLSDVDPFIPVGDHDCVKFKGFLLNALNPRTPQAVLTIIGAQGSGKSTLARIAKRLVDPTDPDLRRSLRDPRDVTAAVRNGYMVAFDNLSKIDDEMSDDLCRIATGGGFGGRKLYFDDEETTFSAIRPVILTAITEVVIRGDLADRALTIHPPERNDELAGYRPEEEFWPAFELARPRILGGLLSAASAALARIPKIRAEVKAGRVKLPRMADLAIFGTAAEPALGLGDGDFIRIMREERELASGAVLESDVIYPPLCEVIAERPFTGQPGKLLEALSARASEAARKDRGWPKSALGLKNHLRRLEPDMRRANIRVTWHESDRHSKRPAFTISYGPPSPAAIERGEESPQSPPSPQTSHSEHETPSPPDTESPQTGEESPQPQGQSPQLNPPVEHGSGPLAAAAATAATLPPSPQDGATKPRDPEGEPLTLLPDPVPGGVEEEPAAGEGAW